MKIFLIITGSIVSLGGLLLIIAQPILGILFAFLGIGFIIWGLRWKKQEPVEISSISYQEDIQRSEEHRHTIIVAGFDYHQDALRPLLTEPNPDYDISKSEWLDYESAVYHDLEDRIYQYETAVYPVHLEAETDNQYDQNAVKVFAADTFIGYLPRGSFPEVAEYSAIPGVRTYIEVFGGAYKYLEDTADDFATEYNPKHYRLMTADSPVKAVIVFEW